MALTKTRLLAASVAGLLAAGLTTATAGAATTYDGLDGPRGLSIGASGKTVVAEADGTVSRIFRRNGHIKPIAKVGASIVAPAVAVSPDDAVWVLTVGGESATAGKLYLVKPGKHRRFVADISRWTRNHPDPFDLEDNPRDTNPFGVAAGPRGSALVADAARNAVLQVWRDGRIRLIAQVKPRTIDVPEELQEAEGLPPRMPAEAVTTSVAMGPNGGVYIGELRGFPGTPGTAEIWRVKPGAHHAICRPARPNQGNCQRFADGLTSIVGLDTGRSGAVFASELSKKSWLALEAQPPVEGAEIGAVIRIGQAGKRSELAAGKVIIPGMVAASPGGRLFVAGPIFGPGAVTRIQ
jgi:hypothetical protein